MRKWILRILKRNKENTMDKLKRLFELLEIFEEAYGLKQTLFFLNEADEEINTIEELIDALETEASFF